MTPGECSSEDDRIAKLTHDLRTPLTIISGFAELLERRAETLEPAQVTEFYGRIADAAREMKEILDSERAQRSG